MSTGATVTSPTAIGSYPPRPTRTRSWVSPKYDSGYTTPRLVARRRVGNATGSVMVSGWG